MIEQAVQSPQVLALAVPSVVAVGVVVVASVVLVWWAGSRARAVGVVLVGRLRNHLLQLYMGKR